MALPLAFLALFFFWPVGAMLVRGVAPGGTPDLSLFAEVLTQPRTWRIFGQTVGMALAATAGSVLLGLPAAYALYRLHFPGQKLLRGVMIAPFALPTVVVGISFRALLADDGPLGVLGLDQSVAAVVLAMIFFNVGLVARTVGVLWAQVAPLDEVARTLGASPFTAFRTVTLPQIGPAVSAAAGLVFLFCSTSFGIVQTLGRPGYGTLESEIYVQTNVYLDLGTAAVLSTLQLLIVVAAILVSNRLTARTETALHLQPRVTRHPRRADAAPILATVATALMLILAPLSALVLGSFTVDGSFSLHNYQLLGQAGAGFSGGTSVLSALRHSLAIALDATVIALLAGIPLALALSRPATGSLARAQRALDGLVLLPLGISAVTVGFGFLITWGRVEWLNSAYVVPLAQAVVALPLVVRSLVPVLRAISPGMREAAATLGASPFRVLLTVDVPFLLRGLGVAFGFGFAISLGEFGATSFLASPDYQTLPVLVARLLGRPGSDNYGMALAGSVILGVGTAAIMVLAEAARIRRSS
ncbi:ABC transporter permease [Corynebacterium guangdongense]|uniref:Thiamine transport system permease protein n=1 Tax=Corynebacterium guangdongense TaxID=1783348 RepID=A0ABU1ZVG1_9CORY|nr:iron ABC transporter permease [Corynebacterium guangdongense]MDR7328348.1 thiamine transport system permease protein [Corynebacterium guangdongense]WJZ16925.1 Putative 2-aminoethylphosphonate transport system permease protein PhnU [Corynebacterium guangdongense]